MTDRLPPLNAVRVFVVAARRLSFTLAAQELHLTHGAVSRQVRKLEEDLGVVLFERRTRQIVLTAEGRRFLLAAESALEQLRQGVRSLRRRPATQVVRIDVRPSFAVKWLIPRLPDFAARHPHIEPQVATSTDSPFHDGMACDVAIRRSLDVWPAAMSLRPFLDDEAIVVGAPAVLAARPVARASDLRGHVMLSSLSRPTDWDEWRRQAGAPRLEPKHHRRFDHLHFVVQAAVDGLGLAIVPRTLVSHDLAGGRLACPLPDAALPLARHYIGVVPEASEVTGLFVAWLEAQPGDPAPALRPARRARRSTP